MQKKQLLSALSTIGLILAFTTSVGLANEQNTDINQQQAGPFYSTLRGYGRVADLNKALAISSNLASIHQSFRSAASKTERQAIEVDLLWAWAYADPALVVEPDKEMIDSLDVNVFGTGLIHGVSNQGYRYFAQAQHDPRATIVVRRTPTGLVRTTEKPKASQNRVNNNWQAPQVKITIPEETIKKIEIINAFADLAPRVFYYLDEPDAKKIVAQINKTYDEIASDLYYKLLADIQINSR